MSVQVNFVRKKIWKKIICLASLKSLKIGVGSGSISQTQRYGSAPKCHGLPQHSDKETNRDVELTFLGGARLVVTVSTILSLFENGLFFYGKNLTKI